MKLWDLRAGNSSRQTFDGKAESARDTQFNPISLFEFASVFDNGCLQMWDLRNPSQWERKWSAHNGLALAVGWNASGSLIGTGGRDKVIKVWDSKSEIRKPAYTIQTIASVSCLRWRPGYDSQIAACSLSHDFRIHIWDFSKPYVPTISLDNHDNVATGIVWRDPDTLLSCSKDESYVINSVIGGYSPASLLNSNSSAWNVYGDVSFTSLKPRTKGIRISNTDGFGKHSQISGAFLCDSLDFSSFSFLAHYYKCCPEDIAGTCDTNTDLANTVGLYSIAKTWKLIKLLFGSPHLPPRNLSVLFKQYHLDASNLTQKRIFTFFKDIFSASVKAEEKVLPFLPIGDTIGTQGGSRDLTNDESSSSDSETSSIDEQQKQKSHYSAAKPLVTSLPVNSFFKDANGVKKSVASDCLELAWSPHNVIIDLLAYYSELGNPQMTTLIALLLESKVQIDQDLKELYTRSYLELLYRFELWPEATRLINMSKIDSVSQLNEVESDLHMILSEILYSLSLSF